MSATVSLPVLDRGPWNILDVIPQTDLYADQYKTAMKAAVLRGLHYVNHSAADKHVEQEKSITTQCCHRNLLVLYREVQLQWSEKVSDRCGYLITKLTCYARWGRQLSPRALSPRGHEISRGC